jgi:hypothetical protein
MVFPPYVPPGGVPGPASGHIQNAFPENAGRVGIEPTTGADYEEPGPALRVHYLHRYHGVGPPITLIELFAQMSRSTKRSTAKG